MRLINALVRSEFDAAGWFGFLIAAYIKQFPCITERRYREYQTAQG